MQAKQSTDLSRSPGTNGPSACTARTRSVRAVPGKADSGYACLRSQQPGTELGTAECLPSRNPTHRPLKEICSWVVTLTLSHAALSGRERDRVFFSQE